MDDAAAANRSAQGNRLSGLGFHLWAADHYRRLAEAAERRGEYADAARYRELAQLEVRLEQKPDG